MEKKNSDFLKENFVKALNGSNRDPVFAHAAKKHFDRVKKQMSGAWEFRSQKELDDVLVSRLFVDNVNTIYPDTKFTCQSEENFDWDFEILPSEVFPEKRLSKEFRKEQFFRCSKVSDILNCTAIGINKAENAYELRVINKYGSARLLCDLDIVVLLPVTKSELDLLKTSLSTGDLIRVAVSKVDVSPQGVRKIIVTLDEINYVLYTRKYLNLGVISKSELPTYIYPPYKDASVSKDKTLTDYLNNRIEFMFPSVLEILNGFGLDTKRHLSFYTNLDKTCPEEKTGQKLIEQMKARDLENYLNLAESEQQCGSFANALDALEECFKFELKCVKAYEIRGKLYADMDKSRINMKAFLDFEVVYALDKANKVAKQYLSKCLFSGAKHLCSTKGEFDKAYLICKIILDELDSTNEQVLSFVNILKRSERPKIRASLRNLPEFKDEENNMEITSVNGIEMSSDTAALLGIKQEKIDEDTLLARLQEKQKELSALH